MTYFVRRNNFVCQSRSGFILFILFLLLASCFLPLSGNDEKKGKHVLIWEITHPAEPGKIFLAGSIHSAKKELYPLDSTYDRVWKQADVICFEIADQKLEDLGKALVKYGCYQGTGQLSQNFSFVEYQKICSFFARHKPEHTPSTMENLRPWVLYMESAQILLQQMPQYKYEYGMEKVLSGYVGQKELRGLESVDSQLKSMSQIPDRDCARLLLEAVTEGRKAEKELQEMFNAVKNGRIKPLEEIILELKVKYPSAYRNLFVLRNKGMAEKIRNCLKEKKIFFVLVGAGHLSGEESVLAELRSVQCVIRQLPRSGRAGSILPEKKK